MSIVKIYTEMFGKRLAHNIDCSILDAVCGREETPAISKKSPSQYYVTGTVMRWMNEDCCDLEWEVISDRSGNYGLVRGQFFPQTNTIYVVEVPPETETALILRWTE